MAPIYTIPNYRSFHPRIDCTPLIAPKSIRYYRAGRPHDRPPGIIVQMLRSIWLIANVRENPGLHAIEKGKGKRSGRSKEKDKVAYAFVRKRDIEREREINRPEYYRMVPDGERMPDGGRSGGRFGQ